MSASPHSYSRLPHYPDYLLFSNTPPTTEIYTLSLHDALPIWIGPQGNECRAPSVRGGFFVAGGALVKKPRSEEHTSELQSLTNLVCRLLLEKKKRCTQER